MYGNVQSRADFARNNVNEVNSLHEAYVKEKIMKKTISILLVALMFSVFMPLTPRASAAVSTPIAVEPAEFKPCPRGTYRVRRNSKKGKKIVGSLVAGGIGAAIGGGIGGGRGALIGLGSGAGGYLVYRYVKDRRGRCVQRYVRG